MKTITISDESYDCIVGELINAKNALEHYANSEGVDLSVATEEDEFDGLEEWQDICKALEELGA